MAYWAPLARNASAAAAARATALFGHNVTRHYLRELDDGSALWAVPAEELAARFWGEIEVAELLHNFGYGRWEGANCGFDLTVPLGEAAGADGEFRNQWQLQVDGDMPLDLLNNPFMEWTETHLFQFAAFAHVLRPDAATAASRPVYGAVNM